MTALIAAGVLRRRPLLVLLLTGAAYAVVVTDFLRTVDTHGLATRPIQRGSIGPIPLIGHLNLQTLTYLGFLFLLGATLQLYRHRVPIHGVLALVAGAALVTSMLVGGFFVVGLPAYAYLLIWAACALPPALHGVGRRHDYSYGIYIYAFPVQQLVALAGGAAWGVLPYIALSSAGALVLAALSWHLIERPALSLKHWTPRRAQASVEAPAERAKVVV